MRLPRTNFPDAANESLHAEDEAEQARRAEGVAARKAYLEQKLAQAREAKRRSELAHEEAARKAREQALSSQPQVIAPGADALPQMAPVAMPLMPPLVPAETAVAPVWQRAFSLAPNVRFTRTPESHIFRPKPVAPAAMPDPPAAREKRTIETIEPISLDEIKPASSSSPSPDEAAPANANEEFKDVMTVSSAFAAIPDFTAQEDRASQEDQAPKAGQKINDGTSVLAYLSDFAFFDAMPYEPNAEQEVQPAAAKPVSAPPKIDRSASVLGLYKIIEWHYRDAAQPQLPAAPAPAMAPVAAEPSVAVAPAVEPQPVFVPAPVILETAAVAAEEPAAIVSEPASAAVASVEEVLKPEVVSEPVAVEPARVQVTVPRRERSPLAGALEWHLNPTVGDYEYPPRELLQEPITGTGIVMTQEALEQNAGLLESVLEDFGVKGEIIHVRPGPVVTLYEFEPAPGVKSSRVIGLADDIARSMSALSARVAVVPGRNVIGIELPNATRETVYFREMIESQDFAKSGYKLALGLGKTIGGEPVIAELAKMPHLLVAGTTGSGKSVAINTMILSLLYRMTPQECRLIMVDPKMLELSVYDGIPHLLTPVVTDPKKAVMALKWAVREMEDRYRKMASLGVRNIDGYNARVRLAAERDETLHVMVQTGFDKGTGNPIEENQELDLTPLPYIVVIVDEMADLMMVAGKEIEGAIQRLAQMARAAGIHLIMATQRPSVDVITGTIKANFPTRISFQVTSKIDSRTILGEQGAEQLLGQGDMLHMQGGGRISRVHGPFVSDEEVEKVVAHLKAQGRPEYLDTVTAGEEDEEEAEEAPAVFDKTAMGAEDGDDLYDQALKVVMRDKKCSTSYIQRRLGIGYNRAASLVERMEKEGLVGAANHVGKREIIGNGE